MIQKSDVFVCVVVVMSCVEIGEHVLQGEKKTFVGSGSGRWVM